MPHDHAQTVSCVRCGSHYDPTLAQWCGCSTPDRTFICPECGLCFCDVPQDFKRTFWNTASRALLDRRDAEQSTRFAPRSEPDGELRRPLVLIAEDNRLDLRLATHVVEGLGYRVINARDGEEAFEAAMRYHPDLILADANMPRLDGRSLCVRVKEEESLSGTPVVIFTSVRTDGFEEESLSRFRADGFVLKPLRPEPLQQLLAQFMKREG
jgi:CheY-like chemotaxis protein